MLDLTADHPFTFKQQHIMTTISRNGYIKHKNIKIFPSAFKDPDYTFKIHIGLRIQCYISISCCKFTPEIKSVSGTEFNLIL